MYERIIAVSLIVVSLVVLIISLLRGSFESKAKRTVFVWTTYVIFICSLGLLSRHIGDTWDLMLYGWSCGYLAYGVLWAKYRPYMNQADEDERKLRDAEFNQRIYTLLKKERENEEYEEYEERY